MLEQPPINQEREPQVLSLDEFSRRNEMGVAVYNNFYLYFAPESFVGGIYQGKEHYLRFAVENQEVAKILCEKVQDEVGRNQRVPESLDSELYEAYKIMRSYGISDTDLFS